MSRPQVALVPKGKVLQVKTHAGDGSVLIGFNLDASETENLAGFAIKRTPPTGLAEWLPNRLSFDEKITGDTTPSDQLRMWTPSNDAPFQKFHWVDFPSDSHPGNYRYDVAAMYFTENHDLTTGLSGSSTVRIGPIATGNCEIGFTRGYLSSQAYAQKFQNKPFEPQEPRGKKPPLLFNTQPFQEQYAWLGFHARKMIFDFLNDCIEKCAMDKTFSVDVFAYDLNEPDFVRGLQKLGEQLRIVSDDSKSHAAATTAEAQVRQLLKKTAGSANIKAGHFKRFAHDKVIILKQNGHAVRVLTGSANFSIRGIYVQANNVLVFDDPNVATLYEMAFQEAFTDMSNFTKAAIASKWFPLTGADLPNAEVSFAPHANASVSLDVVANAIQNAKSSVLFAVMELQGGGPVLQQLLKIHSEQKIFSYGITQSAKGISVFKPGQGDGILVPFSFLSKHVPQPFVKEWNGGMGQVIHHKFVVVDFNGANPAVFCGSSNLSTGGEESNGDNLLAINDPQIAQAYAVEAIRLVEHYQFRAAMQSATSASPLKLQAPGDAAAGKGGKQKAWWQPYYDPKNIKFSERTLFAR